MKSHLLKSLNTKNKSYACNSYVTHIPMYTIVTLHFWLVYVCYYMCIHICIYTHSWNKIVHIYSFLILFCFFGCMLFVLDTPRSKMFYFCLLIWLIVIIIRSGAPGWLSRLGGQLRLRSDLMVPDFETHVGLCADSSEPGACFRICDPPSLCPLPSSCSVSVSQKINKR